ncbi:hypothetical protein J2S09_000155 [Bacillus fengqiuensis]|nr:hypothetical protein [Bacillus fengqiuensis]
MRRLLLEDKPLIVLPSLALELGLNEAIFLQQLHYWLQGSRNERDGHVWVYNTYGKWQEQFPFWSISTIRRIIGKLETGGYIQTEQFNSSHNNQTKWYRIDYSKFGETDGSAIQNEHGNGSTWTADSFNLNHSLQESTSENTNRKKDDDEGASAFFMKVGGNENEQADSEPIPSDMEHDAYGMMLERAFLERRGRGLYPSAKDLQAIEEVVQSGIGNEEAIKWLNEAFDAYKPKYPGDRIHSFSYVKEHIFRQAYLEKERERTAAETRQKNTSLSGNFMKSYGRTKSGRKEMVPDWLESPQTERERTEHQPDFEEEKRKLMLELAQYKKNEVS